MAVLLGKGFATRGGNSLDAQARAGIGDMTLTNRARAIVAGALLLAAAGAAQAGDYAFDIPRKYPALLSAWRAAAPAKFKTTVWVWNFSGTAGPLEERRIGGKPFLLGWVCKPHDCGDNKMTFLLAKDGSAAYGLVTSPALGGATLIGAPPAEALAILKGAL